MDIDVDMVFTYVDGNDPKYINKKAEFYNKNNRKFNPPIRSLNIDEIRYAIYSVIKFIPWIRKIFIVTDDQKPPIGEKLLNSGKIVIIDHKDIIDTKYLPTFNSDVIESYLHKIPGLSNIFMYNNDDMMHFNHVNRSDVYLIEKIPDNNQNNKGKNNNDKNDKKEQKKPRTKIIFKIRNNFRELKEYDPHKNEYQQRLFITSRFLQKEYPDIKLIHNHHTKFLRKSTLEYIEKIYPNTLDNLRRNHLRSNNYIQFLFFAVNIDNYYYKNKVLNRFGDVYEKHYDKIKYNPSIFEKIYVKKPKFACLNSMDDSMRIGFQAFMEDYLS